MGWTLNGGSGGSSYEQVTTFADLPEASSETGKVFVVLTASGLWPFSRKPAGMYYSDGATWSYMSAYPEIAKDSNFAIQNSTDGTKVIKLDASEITSNNTRTLTMSDSDLNLNDLITQVNDSTLALVEHAGTGLNNPTDANMITQTGVYEYSISAGSGYISNNTSERKRITWSSMTGLVPIGIGANYIRINSDGALDVSLDGTYNVDNYIELGYIFTGYAGTPYILAVINTPKSNSKFTSRVNDFMILCLRSLVKEGTGVSALVSPAFGLQIASGSFYSVMKPITLGSTTNFTKVFQSSDTGWTPDLNNLNLLNPNVYNDITKPYGQSLVNMTSGYWKQDVVFRIPDGQVFVVYGQAQYATEAECDTAPLATVPSDLQNVAIFLAKINLQQGSTSISSDCIYDIRPYLPRVFGFGSASAGSVQSHHSLTDLTNGDDHTQYLNDARGDLRYYKLSDGIDDSDITFTDITTNDVSITKHGYTPKAPNDTSKFLRGDGTWNTPIATVNPAGNDTEIQYNNAGSLGGATGAKIVSNILTIVAKQNFADSAIPSSPSSGYISLFSRNLAGKSYLSALSSAGADYPLQPALFDKNIIMWLPGTSTTAAINFGTSWTVTATQAHPTIATTSMLTSMRRATFTTSTTSGNASGVISSTPICWRGNASGLGGFFYKSRFGFVTVQAAMQFFVGLTAQTTILSGDPSAMSNTVGIGKLTGGTNMILIFNNAGTITTVDTGVAPANNAIYDFSMFCAANGSNITIRLVNIVTNTVVIDNISYSTNLPANSAMLIPHADIRTNAASAVSLALNKIYIESDI